jgi:hypothetical protein
MTPPAPKRGPIRSERPEFECEGGALRSQRGTTAFDRTGGASFLASPPNEATSMPSFPCRPATLRPKAPSHAIPSPSKRSPLPSEEPQPACKAIALWSGRGTIAFDRSGDASFIGSPATEASLMASFTCQIATLRAHAPTRATPPVSKRSSPSNQQCSRSTKRTKPSGVGLELSTGRSEAGRRDLFPSSPQSPALRPRWALQPATG